VVEDNLLSVVEDTVLHYCGGRQLVEQQREQWQEWWDDENWGLWFSENVFPVRWNESIWLGDTWYPNQTMHDAGVISIVSSRGALVSYMMLQQSIVSEGLRVGLDASVGLRISY